MTDEQLIAEVREQFAGAVPNVLSRMREAGVLATHWPKIRSVLAEPEPIPDAVVQALLTVLTLRCSNIYCFVMHSLTLVELGATPIAIEELARVFDMPAIVADHERWSRALKLAWLTQLDGPQQAAADFALRRTCSATEHTKLMRVCEVGALLNDFVRDARVTLERDPVLEQLPAELRSLVPEFVQFHLRMNRTDARQRPVAAMCSVCRALRSTDDHWYPFDVARELLADDVLFSHGLCPRCLVGQETPPELH